MTAATVQATTGRSQLRRDLLRIQRGRSGRDNLVKSAFMLKFAPTANIPTTALDEANDKWVIADFTDVPHFYLSNLSVTMADLDGATGLVWDLVALTAAGVVDRVLINDSTVGRTAGFDELDANLGHLGYDLGGKRVAINIVTAATTPAAGAVSLVIEGYGDMETFT
jgi:hypothetical protein